MVWFCCWLVELRTRHFSKTNSNILRIGLFLLLICWIGTCSLTFINRGVGFGCWLVELTRKLALATKKKLYIGFFFSVDLLIWHILSFIYESWMKGWCDFTVDLLNPAEIYFQQLKKELHIGFFLCWLVDMAYSIMSCIYQSWEMR